MKKLIFILVFLFSQTILPQDNLGNLLKKYNKNSVPYITVDNLQKISDNLILLDAREFKEYKVSHIKNAQYVGYKMFDLEKTLKILPKEKDTKIVVYCSLGVRSSTIAKHLKKAGYTNILNLYGGIFEWKNNDLKVYNFKGKETEKVHAYNYKWGVWLKKGIKVYE